MSFIIGGNNRARTCDPLLVRQVLSQLSYAPTLACPPADISAGDKTNYTISSASCQPFYYFFLVFFVLFSPAALAAV